MDGRKPDYQLTRHIGYPAQAAAACVLCVVAYVPSVSKSNKVQFSINVYKVCTVLFKLICINFIKCIDKWM